MTHQKGYRNGKIVQYSDRSEELIDRSLPYVKREGVRIIEAQYESHDAARASIRDELKKFYAENYPDVAEESSDAIDAAAGALADAYALNVFPEMQVWWDTYPDHIGHEQSDGCTRCHKRAMRTAEREQIDDDCETCHIILAEEEENANIMTLLNPE